jgi:nitrate reductase gamma subunit
MSDSDVLFRALPYAAALVLLAGSSMRAVLALGRMRDVRRASAEALASMLGGWRARACVAGLGVVHLVALAWPRAIVRFGAAPWRLVVLEVVGLALALATFAIAARATARLCARGHSSVLFDLADSAFLALVLVALASGVLTAVLHRWVSSWAAATIAPWARSLLSGRPDTTLVAHLPLLARIHLVASLAAIALFPLSRLGALPIVLAAAAAARVRAGLRIPLAAAGRALERLRERLAIGARLWPDREIRWLGPMPGDPRRSSDVSTNRQVPGLPGGPRVVPAAGPRT